MTTRPTSWNRFSRTRFRLLYLLVVTGGAIATTLYLIAPNTERWSPATCWLVFAAAWGSTIAAWRRHRPHLRRWFGVYTFGVLFLGFFAMVVLLNGLWTTKEPSHVAAPLSTADPAYQRVLARGDLRIAIGKNDLAAVEAILRTADADIVVRGPSASAAPRPLDKAVEKGNRQIVAVLLDHGAAVADKLHNPLVLAARRDDAPMLRLLIHHDAPLHSDSWGHGNQALWDAVFHGKAKAVDCLLTAGVNPNAVVPGSNYDESRRSILRFARQRGNRPIVERLKRAGATE